MENLAPPTSVVDPEPPESSAVDTAPPESSAVDTAPPESSVVDTAPPESSAVATATPPSLVVASAATAPPASSVVAIAPPALIVAPTDDAIASSNPPKPATPIASIENLKHKNRLHDYVQRSAIPLPVYQTINEGFDHAPRFRCFVTVDGHAFSSSSTFFHIKEAEQDAARVALELIELKIKQGGCPLLHEDAAFSKSILNEFAAKMSMPLPTYEVTKIEGPLPMFISNVRFHGENYSGVCGRSKKEAEQMAARAAIESILATSFGTTMFQIIKAKNKIFAAMHKGNETMLSQNKSPGGATMEAVTHQLNSSVSSPLAAQPPQYQTNMLKGGYTYGPGLLTGNSPVFSFLQQNPSSVVTNWPAAQTSARKRRNRKKKKDGHQTKKPRAEEQLVPVPTLSMPAA